MDVFSLTAVHQENFKNDEGNIGIYHWIGMETAKKRLDLPYKAHHGCPLSLPIKMMFYYGYCVLEVYRWKPRGKNGIHTVVARVCIWRTGKLSHFRGAGVRLARLQAGE